MPTTTISIWTKRILKVLMGIFIFTVLYLCLFFGLIYFNIDHTQYDRTDISLNNISDDFDGDTVANANDNCIAIANNDQADRDANGLGDACDNECPLQTARAINAMTPQAFDELFVIAGQVNGSGPIPDTGPTAGIAPIVQPVAYGTSESAYTVYYLLGGWIGKYFYTASDGNSAVVKNRMLNGHLIFWPHDVSYGTSVWDGKPVINIVARAPFNMFPDEVRLLEKGIYIGYTLNEKDNYFTLARWGLNTRCPDTFQSPFSDDYDL